MNWSKSNNPEPVPAALRRPLPDGVFPDIAASYTAHDDTCLSLPDFWLARTGGVTALGDLRDCDGCSNTFYNEGVVCTNYDDPDADEWLYYCGCCATQLGYTVRRTPYGLSREPTPTAEQE